MYNTPPRVYKSVFDGVTIEELLNSIKTKIDISYIVNNFNGGTELIASAELAKILYNKLDQFNDPNYIQQLFLTIPNSTIFTPQMLEQLNRLGSTFVGSYANPEDRNISVATTNFKGGEITFLLNDGNGQQELSYWDAIDLKWKKSIWTPSPIIPQKSVPTAGNTVVYSISDTTKTYGKYVVVAKTSTDVYSIELSYTRRASGADIIWTVQNEMGSKMVAFASNSITPNPIIDSSYDIALVSFVQNGLNIDVVANMITPQMIISLYRIAEF